MRALVVFESMFGNTRDVAAAVAEGLGSHLSVDLVEVGSAPTEIDAEVSLLVVGGPTHAFGMSRPETRRSAADKATGPVVSGRIGLRDWLAALARSSDGAAAATFDTRVSKPRAPGSAARKAERRLRRMGFDIVAAAANFWVTGVEGSLVDGELERARRWGEQIGSDLRHRASAGP